MKKILIMSDSHGLTSELEQIMDRHSTDDVFHCGDSELNVNHALLKHMRIVKGNCDFGNLLPEEKMIKINEMNILLTHGHLYHVDRDLTSLSYRASELNAQIVCYGHTHIAYVAKHNGQIFINPGSIYSSRDRRERTYAILNVTEDCKIYAQFYAVDGQLLDDLEYEADLSKYV